MEKKHPAMTPPPPDAATRRAVRPVICYPVDSLPPPDLAAYAAARRSMRPTETLTVPPGQCKGLILAPVCT